MVWFMIMFGEWGGRKRPSPSLKYPEYSAFRSWSLGHTCTNFNSVLRTKQIRNPKLRSCFVQLITVCGWTDKSNRCGVWMRWLMTRWRGGHTHTHTHSVTYESWRLVSKITVPICHHAILIGLCINNRLFQNNQWWTLQVLPFIP